MEDQEREIEKILVRVATNYSEGIQDFECVGISIDDDFINLQMYDNEEEDLLSIKKDDVRVISSKRIYKDELEEGQ